jgi:hypothetical protein
MVVCCGLALPNRNMTIVAPFAIEADAPAGRIDSCVCGFSSFLRLHASHADGPAADSDWAHDVLRLLLNAVDHMPGGRGARYSLDALQGDSLERFVGCRS